MAPASLIGEIAPVTDHRSRHQQPVRRARECAGSADRTVARGGRRSLMALRPLGPDNGLLPAAGGAAPTQVVLAFDDNRLASVLFGQYGQNLALIERRLGVVAEQRGNTSRSTARATPSSRRAACWKASTSSSSAATTSRPATSKARSGSPSRRARCSTSIRRRARPASRRSTCASARCARAPPRRTPISARCARHALVFGTGPAGTGKT